MNAVLGDRRRCPPRSPDLAGAVFALMVVPVDLFDAPITAMDQAPTTTISGPFSENFKWNRREIQNAEAQGPRTQTKPLSVQPLV